MKYLLLLCALLLALPASAEIYKWTDAAGRTHFGDQPTPTAEAQKVEVRVNTFKAVKYRFPKAEKKTAAKQVVMYATSWCGYCRKAREHFQRRGIAYVEYDVEKDLAARQEFDNLGGTGYPLIVVGEMLMSGFEAAAFDRLYRSGK